MGLRFERALRFGHPVFGDIGERLDQIGHGISACLGDFAAFARRQPFGGGLAEILERAGDIDREGFRVADQVGFGGSSVETGRFSTLFLCPAVNTCHAPSSTKFVFAHSA
ncbi:hypothetical protein D3C78_1281120 [compost metagenome]